ncbi:MAG TPA: hypothetical protein VE487_03335 [Ilumatobacter sp.]|nr:hypothetical protein [Ilumatobacter sp.]
MTISDDPSRIETSAVALVLLASSVGDPAGTRTITSIVLLLTVLGIALLMIAIWLFRLTRPDKELLAPLEVMSERKWRRADPVWQRRRLDEVRPAEAQPLQPSAAPPDFDKAFFEQGPAAAGFDDLHEDAQPNGEPSPVPEKQVEMSEAGAPVQPAVASPVQPAVASPVEPDVVRVPAPATPAQLAPSLKPVSPTPTGIDRPMELPERDIDPEVMAAAIAELDAELRLGEDRNPPPAD